MLDVKESEISLLTSITKEEWRAVKKGALNKMTALSHWVELLKIVAAQTSLALDEEVAELYVELYEGNMLMSDFCVGAYLDVIAKRTWHTKWEAIAQMNRERAIRCLNPATMSLRKLTTIYKLMAKFPECDISGLSVFLKKKVDDLEQKAQGMNLNANEFLCLSYITDACLAHSCILPLLQKPAHPVTELSAIWQNAPLVSVVMPVYNAEKFIGDAIKSVLAQTYSKLELIIVDDGSLDHTCSIIQSFQDARIRLFKMPHDYISSLNYGLEQAQGKYIARMDADDIMNPDRIRIQTALMERRSDVSICGSWMLLFGAQENNVQLFATKAGYIPDVCVQLLHGNFICHPTILMRREFMKEKQIKYRRYHYAEDMKMWFEAAQHGAVFYIEPQPLLYYRSSESQVSVQKTNEQQATTRLIQQEIADYLIEHLAV